MKRLLLGTAILVVIAVVVVAAHMAFIEIGREVVTLRTQRADGSWQNTRLWIVDDGGSSWLHSGGSAWLKRFETPSSTRRWESCMGRRASMAVICFMREEVRKD